MSIVVDCSIALSWYLPDESNSAANEVLDLVSFNGAFIPFIFKAEFSNSLLMAIRRNRINESYREKVLAAFDILNFVQDDAGSKKCWPEGVSLCDRHSLTAYDATYLELAVRQKVPLATLDKKLAAAALLEGVRVLGQTD